MTPQEAARRLLADHIPTPVARTSAHGGDWRMRCCCGGWNGWDYDLPDHYARVLADAGLLKEDT